MTGNIMVSTGARNQNHQKLREIFSGGHINFYEGSAPATSDAAATGQLLFKVTRASLTSKAKRKITITPTVGSAASAVWNLTINGTKVSFTDDGTPSTSEVSTGLYNAIRVAAGIVAVTTPPCTINDPSLYGLIVATDNTGSISIEAATEGVTFSSEVSVTGAGAGSGSMAIVEDVADAYGIHFEDAVDIENGVLEKLASEVWSGVALADGTVGYWRLVQDSDTGALSTSQPRIQGLVNTSNSAITIRNVNIYTGETQTVDSFKITAPAS